MIDDAAYARIRRLFFGEHWKIGTISGTSDSPTISGGRAPSSNTTTEAPLRASNAASVAPAGPAPMIATRVGRCDEADETMALTPVSALDFAARRFRQGGDKRIFQRQFVAGKPGTTPAD